MRKFGLLLFLSAFIAACGSGETKEASGEIPGARKDIPKTLAEAEAKYEEYRGIGPVKELTLGELDQAMADQGMEIYKLKCTACHKTDKRFIGPAPKDILNRRTPEWIMNMILNPVEMVTKDPIAKLLLIEFNGSPMANQSLTEEEARAVLEYFRTL